MVDFLQSLTQGLRGAAGVLSPEVYSTQMQQDELRRQEALQQRKEKQTQQAQQMNQIKESIQNGSMDAAAGNAQLKALGYTGPEITAGPLALERTQQLKTAQATQEQEKSFRDALRSAEALRTQVNSATGKPYTEEDVIAKQQEAVTQFGPASALSQYVTGRVKEPTKTEFQKDLIAAYGSLEHPEAKKKLEARLKRETAPTQTMINVATGGAGGAGGAVDEGRASVYMSGGTLGMGKDQKAKAVAEVKKLYPELSYAEVAQKGEVASHLNKSLSTQQVLRGKVLSFEKTALGNLEQLERELDAQMKSGKTDIPAVNKLLNAWMNNSGQVYGEGTRLFGQEVAAELAKLASSATAAGTGGTLTDREEWKSFFGENGSYAQMKKSLNSAKTAISIRTKSAEDAYKETLKEMEDLWPKKGGAVQEAPKPAVTSKTVLRFDSQGNLIK